MAFKTPLDSKYDEQVPIMNRFNTEMLFSSMANMKVLYDIVLMFFIGNLSN